MRDPLGHSSLLPTSLPQKCRKPTSSTLKTQKPRPENAKNQHHDTYLSFEFCPSPMLEGDISGFNPVYKVSNSLGINENRSIFESLEIGWELLRIFPRSSLKHIDPPILDKYFARKSRPY